MKTRNPISEALVQLRAGLKETQQQFANRMHTAITTIARYETSRPPKGKVLAELERIAIENDLPDCAAVFRAALAKELGAPPPRRKVHLNPQRWHEKSSLPDLYERCVRNANLKGLKVAAVRMEFDRSDGTTLVADLAVPEDQKVNRVKRVFMGAARTKGESE